MAKAPRRGGRPKAKQPYKRFSAAQRPARAKKGRTGGKRRGGATMNGTMQRHAAPVQAGYSVAHGKKGPGGVGYSMTQVSDTCTRITGRAYVGEVSTTGKIVAPTAPATSTTGNCLGLIFDVNPALLNDRVAVIASTFEKYVFHGVKFTYVPQCPTSTPGSVGMVFDRDPLQMSANPRGPQFLSEVMSYEHAVLTPAYVEASTSYARDPKELKTWYLGAPDATLTTRETSQGNLLVYLSNAQNATAYGFIVMDYVLDLVAPNLLPSKQSVTNIKLAPSQWRDFNGANAVTTAFTANGALVVPYGGGGGTAACFWDIPAAWTAKVEQQYLRPGVVGEFHIGGCRAAAGVDGTSYVAPGFAAADGNSQTFTTGQKLYFCVHVVNNVAGADSLVLSFHTTLSSARASASEGITQGGALTAMSLPDQVFATPGAVVEIGGWMRLISPGASVQDTA